MKRDPCSWVIQEGFQGEEGFELSFGGWSLVPFGFISKKLLFFFPRLLWAAVLRACTSSEVGLGRASLSPEGPFSCRSVTLRTQEGEDIRPKSNGS